MHGRIVLGKGEDMKVTQAEDHIQRRAEAEEHTQRRAEACMTPLKVGREARECAHARGTV
eukprot:2417244-Pleurochrysis_carterae.AAC.1